MSNITKIAMAQSLKRMLLIKDLDKITISDITNDCGINRQTFYYHFKDIYDLLEWIFTNEVVKKIEKETTIKNWQENFKYVLDYMLENKKFIIKTYNSLSRKTLLDFLFKQYNTIFIDIINDVSKNYNITKENKTYSLSRTLVNILLTILGTMFIASSTMTNNILIYAFSAIFVVSSVATIVMGVVNLKNKTMLQ